MKPIKILLVDDHKLIRDAIRSYLESDPAFEIIGEAISGEDALVFVEKRMPDVVIMDINMDGMGGIAATGELISRYPGIHVIALTMLNEHLHIKQMFDAGATGYLLKNCNEEDIKQAVNMVMKGGMYYSSEVHKSIMESLMKKDPTSKPLQEEPFPLTAREKEVLKLIAKEYSNKEIADKLTISVRTVDAHRRNLMEKSGAKNTAGLVLFAVRQGLIENI